MKFINAYQYKNDKKHIILKFREHEKIKYKKIPIKNYFFVEDKNGTFVSILDSDIHFSKVYNNNISTHESDTSSIDRFYINSVEKYFEKLEIQDLKFLFYDIETHASLDVSAKKPILSIAFTTNYTNRNVVFIWRDDFKYKKYKKDNTLLIVKFPSEKEMLLSFIKVLKKTDVIVGFNSSRFDDLYLFNRFKHFNILNTAKLFNNIYVTDTKIYSDYVFLDARVLIQAIFSRASDIEKPSVFSLNSLSELLLNDKKVQNIIIVDAWKNNYELLCEYNAKDVELLKRLCEKTKILQAFIDRLNFVKVKLDKVYVNSYIIDIILRRLNKNKVFPTKKWYDKDFELKGAIVLEPKQGIYKNVGVFDFSAMYPNTILVHKISPDKDKKILPTLIEYLMKLRYKYKRLQSTTTNREEKQIYKANEMIVKDLINSCYGVFAYRGFRLFSPVIANEITKFAREEFMSVYNFVTQQLKLQVILGDTDSLFIKVDENKIDDVTQQINSFLANKYDKRIKMNCETFFKILCVSNAKKTYLGLVNLVKDRKTEKLEFYAKGFQLIRSDTPKFFKRKLAVAVYNLFLDLLEDKNTYIDLLKTMNKQIREVSDVTELLISKQISRDINEYKVIPQHVRAMKFSNENLNTNFNRINFSGGMLYVKHPSTDVIMLDFEQKNIKIKNGLIEVNNKKFKIDYEKYMQIYVKQKFSLLNSIFTENQSILTYM